MTQEEEPPFLGEIALLIDGYRRFSVIFTSRGWRVCRAPETVDPAKVERDEVCKFTRGRRVLQ